MRSRKSKSDTPSRKRRRRRPPRTERLLQQACDCLNPSGAMKSMTRRLHEWMDKHRIPVTRLTAADVQRFLDQLAVNNQTRCLYRRELVRYLEWLWEKGWCSFDPDALRIRGLRRRRFWLARPLPPIAGEFIKSLQPTLKPSTWQGYQTCLRRFHGWLDAHHVTLRRLTRGHMSQWMQSLAGEDLHPSTRVKLLIDVRIYLRWLHEHRILRANPDELVRVSDFPKLPIYLPRPLPPDADVVLRQRLAASPSLHHQGLLVMRNTGLRLGELLALAYDCIRSDHAHNRFLKVPLGKLNNERLVPLDEGTFALIQRLRRHGRRHRTWLLESPSGTPTRPEPYRQALRDACQGLDTHGPMVTHRLRHTFATSILNGGMSLLGVMKLLGHRDYRMTLRYAAITQETVRKEYFEALSQIEARYRIPARSDIQADPAKLISDAIRWIQNHARDHRRARSLIRRLRRLRTDLDQLRSRREP